MPPASSSSLLPQKPIDSGHMLASPEPSSEGGLPPGEKRSGIGPIVGIVVIILLLAVGGLYFWGAYLDRKNSTEELPFIPGDSTQDSE